MKIILAKHPRNRYKAYPKLTCTGIDESTDTERLFDLYVKYNRFLEIGILYSTTNAGNRYPSLGKVQDLTCAFFPKIAVHICGMKALEELLDGQIFDGYLPARIQINGYMTESRRKSIIEAIRMYPEVDFITQVSPNTTGGILDEDRHHYLLDQSAGRGILPHYWSDVYSNIKGFAGGLSPENLDGQLPAIQSVGGDRWWCDMESGLRTDDWFDLDKMNAACHVFSQFLAKS